MIVLQLGINCAESVVVVVVAAVAHTINEPGGAALERGGVLGALATRGLIVGVEVWVVEAGLAIDGEPGGAPEAGWAEGGEDARAREKKRRRKKARQ